MDSRSVVRMKGLEPPSLAALDPKSSVSTNFTTSAFCALATAKIVRKNYSQSVPTNSIGN